MEEVTNRYSQLSLEEEEEVGFVMDNEEDTKKNTEPTWVLEGRFLTDPPVNTMAMKHTLAAVWRPVKGIQINNLHYSLFLFQFFHELDMQRVVEGGP